MRSKTLLLLAVIASGVGQSAAAASISLFNTGVSATGTLLPGGSSDPHWTIISGPGITTPQSGVVVNNQEVGVYAQSPNSQWIWVNASGNGAINSPFDFRLTFNLTGLDPRTANITGSWGVDNSGQILLNGLATGIGSGELSLPGTVTNNFAVLHNFTLNNGFVAGINTLDIIATDTGNPGAINVTSLIGTAQTIPEPSSLVLGCLAIVSLGLIACARLRFRRCAA
jgi:hypothetical protein